MRRVRRRQRRRRAHVAPPSVLTSTRVTGARPDQARPVRVTGPARTKRSRVMKSGQPGGASSDRGRMRVTGSPSSSASTFSR